MLGLSCYAVEDFDDCKKYWREALRLLKKMDKIPDSLIAISSCSSGIFINNSTDFVSCLFLTHLNFENISFVSTENIKGDNNCLA